MSPDPPEPSPEPPFGAGEPAPPHGRTTLGVWALAWPSMTLFALHALVGIVDFIFVAALGKDAVAAVGAASQIHFLAFALLAAVTTGTVALVAREWGAGNRSAAAHATRTSLLLATVVGVLMMTPIPWTRALVAMLGLEPAVSTLGGDCLAILLLFNAPFFAAVVIASALRGAGDVRTPLFVGIVINAVNIVLDWALIFGRLGAPALGARGSAWATGVAFSLEAVLFLALWRRGSLVVPWESFRDAASPDLARRLLRIGIPTALEQSAFNVGLLFFMSIVARFGTEPVAAYLIGVRILSFCFIPGFGYAAAGATLVGQHLGAKDPGRAARAGWSATAGAVAVMGSVGLVIVAFAEPLAGWFGAVGPETIALTVTFTYILGAAQPFMAMEFALGGALRGAGDTRFPLAAILTGLFFFRLGGALLVAIPLFGTVTAVWCCLIADYAVKASLLAWRFRAGRWKQVEV